MNSATALTIFFLLLQVHCSGQGLQTPSPKDIIPNYFPLETFRDTAMFVGYDQFVVTWYSKHLHALREPILCTDESNRETYRFLWLRTFHHPVAIRIERSSDSYMLFWKQADGAGGYDPGKMVIDSKMTIDKKTWDIFLAKLNALNFWQLPTNQRNFGNDGSQWVLEARTREKYHVVDRWTPEKSDKYYQACDFLIKLTDLRIKGDDKY